MSDNNSLNIPGFTSMGDQGTVEFDIQLKVVNGTNDTCDSNQTHVETTFCPNSTDSDYVWKLCDRNVFDSMTFSEQSLEDIESKDDNQQISRHIIWLSLVHGSISSSFSIFNIINDEFMQFVWPGNVPLTLTINKLKCNPSLLLMKCVLSELFSWIKVYSESKDIPVTWDQKEKGYVTFDYKYHNSRVMKFMSWPISTKSFVKLSLVEYVFVSLSLAVIIAKFFPGIHNQIVSKATDNLEYGSLYWGLVVVCNVLTYGLVFVATRIGSFYIQYSIFSALFLLPDQLDIKSLYLLSFEEFVVYVILFIGALFASLRNDKIVSMPTGMGKVLINISFCFSCFCLCICCSQKRRENIFQVLIFFSFMSLIYHVVMDVISIGFILFNEYRILYITLTLLYISLILFFVAFLSFSILFYSRDGKMPFYTKSLNYFAGALMLITVFGAVMLIVIMYMILFFSLKLTGVIGIIIGVVPSIALNAVSWYIKKRLQKEEEAHVRSPEMRVNAGGSQVDSDDSANEGQIILPP